MARTLRRRGAYSAIGIAVGALVLMRYHASFDLLACFCLFVLVAALWPILGSLWIVNHLGTFLNPLLKPVFEEGGLTNIGLPKQRPTHPSFQIPQLGGHPSHTPSRPRF